MDWQLGVPSGDPRSSLPDEPHDMDRVRRTLLVCEKKRKKEKTKRRELG